MRAEVGDTLVVVSRRVGEPKRRATILKIRGRDGSPPCTIDFAWVAPLVPEGGVEVVPADAPS